MTVASDPATLVEVMRSLAMVAVAFVSGCGTAGSPTKQSPPTARPTVQGPQTAEQPSTPAKRPSASGCFAKLTRVRVTRGSGHVERCAQWASEKTMGSEGTVEQSGENIVLRFDNDVEFIGSAGQGIVSAVHEQRYPWEDGCVWNADESLVGSLDPSACKLSLTYRYAEEVAKSDGSCYSGCRGERKLVLSPIGETEPSRRPSKK